ncbi:MAG TPA: hypothetical protein VK483_10030 [Chitinophagaceae bacterium]|nr:hypothetical protein [Chitinophagaceae bacterium]
MKKTTCKLLSGSLAVLMIAAYLISCDNKKMVPQDKKISADSTTTTTVTTAETEKMTPAPQVLDTVEAIDRNFAPGRYAYKTPKGNYYTFDVNSDSAGSADEEKEMTITDARAVANPPCNHDVFDASNRLGVKTTSSTSALETDMNPKTVFSQLMRDEASLIERFTFPLNQREQIENRNVEFKKIYIYTFTREGDEDYHLIVGTTANPRTAFIFNIEISGKPPHAGSVGRANIVKARKDFEDWFQINGTCRTGYVNNDWRSQPVPIWIKGSLFYDEEHGKTFARNGPQNWPGIKLTTAWEIHPVTFIKFYD